MKLLLAEDERSLSKALTAILEHNGYTVDAVYDGVEALEYLEMGEYDGLILDIMMPRMDGMTALQKIREQGNQIPILMLTAKSEVDDKVAGLDNGANDYLTKPFASKELLARIRAMTRTQTVAVTSVLQFGNISLDQATKELSSPSGEFHLANKEFQVMELLMSNPKNVIPTERIMERVWGYDSNAELNVVWAYISYLRKKLTALHADIQIKATRNTGYSLEVKQ
ncbi:response regulator transcription factor [Dorea sp.]|nr:response regulator transcription factor [uncultured Dorea sp.]